MLGVHDLVIIDTKYTMMVSSCERELEMEKIIEEVAARRGLFGVTQFRTRLMTTKNNDYRQMGRNLLIYIFSCAIMVCVS